jgi:hypothetical protein
LTGGEARDVLTTRLQSHPLRLVHSVDRVVASPRRPTRDLVAAPFRPGELPSTVVVQLEPAARSEVEAEALRARVPLALCLRIVVEATRARDDIVRATGRNCPAVEHMLDVAAELPIPPDGSEDSGLSTYVAALIEGQIGGGNGSDVVLRLTTEMAFSWGRRAAESDLTLDAWITRSVKGRPTRAVQWEVAAAASGRTLAEWAYASALLVPTSLASTSA